MDKVYSNRLILGYLKLMDKKAGSAATNHILEEIGLDRLKMSDSSGFHSKEDSDALTQAAIKLTGEPDLSYLTGRDFPNSMGILSGFILGATSPSFLMRTFGEFESKLALKTVNTTRKIGNNRFRVDITFKDGFREMPYICRNRIGCYETAPIFFGLPYAQVDHPECAFQGSDHCVYIIQFPEYGFSIFNRIFQACLFVALAMLIFWLTAPSRNWPLPASLGLACAGFFSFAYYRGQSAKKSMDWSLLTNEGLTKQNQTLANTNVQMSSLQDLTTLLNNCVQVKEICEQVVATMVNRFHFGSSQIWLLDEKSEYLSCKSALGYTRELLAFIINTKFKIGENWDNPYGLLIQTLEQKKTLLFNDPKEVYARVTKRTREFLEALNISSFIITPLIHEGKPLGILAAEFHQGEKLVNQDKVLFQSVSNIVANALVKAGLIESMAHKIEQRTQELEVANRKLLSAQEMSIQSEKLSSLGQMAAGVAHEINNPLNFLVNIIPDLRRDVDGLEKIRELVAQSELSGELKKSIQEIDEQYDLESHLSEKNFVFEKIQKALDKSTRIANSLKVFSRSSSKEKSDPEKFSDMIRDVIELIPQKVRGDTQIVVDLSPDLTWSVNKNEVEQAFLALINNAIDAMEQKGKLEISGLATKEEIRISFKDQGPGISEAALKKIFDPFYTTKPPGKGTGLGLTIASEIIKKYGGVMTANSVLGQGATFELRFKKIEG